MTDPSLSRSTLPAGVSRTPIPTSAGIVHLGLGNFHRAHQAVYTAAALQHEPGAWGIHAFGNRSRTVASAMRDQDMLYAVLDISTGGCEVSVPGVHIDAGVAADDPAAVVAAIAAPTTKVTTLTVTERGYTYAARSDDLDLTDDDIQRDLLRQSPPLTTVGQVAGGLALRWKLGGAPITVVSCDNLSHNGTTLKRLVRAFSCAGSAPLPDEFLDWLDQHVAFPCTMVDRIVPGTTDLHREMVREALGVRDAVPVPAEPFSMWVLEDRFTAGRPAWERGGAIFTDDVGAYEQLKLRLLNGTHSLIAYLGVLAGKATIPESVGLPFVEAAARRLMCEEYLPTVAVPDAVDAEVYTEQLFSRFSNAALGHRTTQVGTDGSQKLPPRITGAALAHHRAGDVPQMICLTVAAFLACLAPMSGTAPALARQIQDPLRETLARHAAAATSSGELVAAIFDTTGLLTAELAQAEPIRRRVAELHHLIEHAGVDEAVREALGGR